MGCDRFSRTDDYRFYRVHVLSLSLNQRLYLIVAEYFKRPLEYNPDGPMMTCLKQPQLMFVRGQKSTFMINRRMNADLQRLFKKKKHKDKGYICCGRYVKEEEE